jgi:ribonuclease P protein component
MLPKQHRLPGHLVYKTLNSTTAYHSPLFSLKILKLKKDTQPSMIGFIISTKLSKLAVQRNRIKRQLKAAIYPQLKNLHPNYQLVLLAKHPIKTASFIEIKKTLNNLLITAQVLTNEKNNSKAN